MRVGCLSYAAVVASWSMDSMKEVVIFIEDQLADTVDLGALSISTWPWIVQLTTESQYLGYVDTAQPLCNIQFTIHLICTAEEFQAPPYASPK